MNAAEANAELAMNLRREIFADSFELLFAVASLP
jgi:hypothetical protein